MADLLKIDLATGEYLIGKVKKTEVASDFFDDINAEIALLDNRVTEVESDIADIIADLTGIYSTLADHQDQIDDANAAIALKHDTDRYTKRKNRMAITGSFTSVTRVGNTITFPWLFIYGHNGSLFYQDNVAVAFSGGTHQIAYWRPTDANVASTGATAGITVNVVAYNAYSPHENDVIIAVMEGNSEAIGIPDNGTISASGRRQLAGKDMAAYSDLIAANISVADAPGNFLNTNLEGVLEELADMITTTGIEIGANASAFAAGITKFRATVAGNLVATPTLLDSETFGLEISNATEIAARVAGDKALLIALDFSNSTDTIYAFAPEACSITSVPTNNSETVNVYVNAFLYTLGDPITAFSTLAFIPSGLCFAKALGSVN